MLDQPTAGGRTGPGPTVTSDRISSGGLVVILRPGRPDKGDPSLHGVRPLMSAARIHRPTDGTYRGILKTWWPLGGKQLMIFAADPIYIAIIMRMSQPDLELGALYTYGWPVLMVIAAPTFTLNAVGNVFGKNVENVRKTRRFALFVGLAGTAILSVIAFTPLSGLVMRVIMDVPEPEQAMVATVFQVVAIYPILKAICMISQGHLIRCGRAGDVLASRVVRLIIGLAIVLAGYRFELLQGAVLGATGIIGSLVAQTAYLWWRSGFARRGLARDPIDSTVVTTATLARFAIPMSIVPIVGSATLLLMAAALGRLPGVVASLAVWPVVTNFSQIGVSLGKSFDQVTIVHGVDEASRRRLRRFGLFLGVGTVLATAVLNASGLLSYLLRTLEALDEETTIITARVMWILTPMPLLLTLCAYYRGLLARQLFTVSILLSKVVALVIVAAVLVWSLDGDPVTGIYAVAAASVVSAGATLAWLVASLRWHHRTG